MARVFILMAVTVLCLAFPAAVSAEDDGVLGEMPAYIGGKLVAVAFTELPAPAGGSIPADTRAHIIYDSDQAVIAGFPFISVLSEAPSEGSASLWREVQIVFAPDRAPRQFDSADAVLAAAAVGEITLQETSASYRCVLVPSD